MAMDFIGLSVGMGYTDETVIGGGAIKGKNCVVSNIEEVADGINVTFQSILDDGTVKTDTAFIPRGTQGETGVDGKSAYEIWLEAGNTGTEEDFLISLVGEKGADGTMTFEDLTEEQKASLKGEQGEQGEQGEAGKSAYQVWLDEGNTGSEEDFLNSLKGEKGADGTMTFEDLTEEQKESLNGEDGKSAYEIWLEAGNTGTEEDFLNSLKGADGFAPVVTVTDIEGGHKVVVEDVNGSQEFEVLDGKDAEGKVYTSLAELGLDTTATINDIIGAMADGSIFMYKTDVFDYATEYNNIQYGTVTIHRQHASRVQVLLTDKDSGNLYVGRQDNTNKIVGWRNETFHRVVAQGTAGYFKFKPTSTGIDQPLRISVTDNYGGMINISGATPSGSQYKPFKCIRLSNGEYSNYDAIKVANNKMLKLFYYDGYFYLKVTTYTTCTFTGLIEAPTYIGTFDEENAEQIPIRSVFDTPYNDGYADPSIIVVGDTDSSDGVIKTLATLGFASDIMTWDTGVYRLSHISGLTNLPAEITEEKPGLRLEHYDMKKWGSNHNPNLSTYGCRQSVLHYKGNVFVRYTESGDTAGVLITDTGWQKLSKTVIIDNIAELGLTAPCTTADVANALKRIKPQRNVAIAIIDIAPGQVTDVPSDYGLLHIETIGYDRISIRFDAVGSTNYKGSWIGKIIGSGGTFSGVDWDKPVTESNTFGGKEVKVLELDLSQSAFQVNADNDVMYRKISSMPITMKVLKIEGYYVPPTNATHSIPRPINLPDSEVGLIYIKDNEWVFAGAGSSSKSGSGYAKIYYID